MEQREEVAADKAGTPEHELKKHNLGALLTHERHSKITNGEGIGDKKLSDIGNEINAVNLVDTDNPNTELKAWVEEEHKACMEDHDKGGWFILSLPIITLLFTPPPAL